MLRALGLDYREARSSIRLGFGRYTTAAGDDRRAVNRIAAARGRAGEARRVTLVRFFRADGTLDKEVEAAPGQRLLDVAWAARQPLEGACEGVMACSTCHVIVDAADFAKLPAASEEEEDLLDLAAHADADLAARLPDHPHRGHAKRSTSEFRPARPTGWGASCRAAADCRTRVSVGIAAIRVFARHARASRPLPAAAATGEPDA